LKDSQAAPGNGFRRVRVHGRRSRKSALRSARLNCGEWRVGGCRDGRRCQSGTYTPGTPLAPPVRAIARSRGQSNFRALRCYALLDLPWRNSIRITEAAVCTCEGASATVGVAELPCENTLVFTLFGITGAELASRSSSWRDADGGTGRLPPSLELSAGDGRRKTLGGGSSCATSLGCGSWRTGWGSWLNRNRSVTS